jgi:UDP-N-acetylmuramate dehydrogenase
MTQPFVLVRNADLRPLNSFGVAARARALARVTSRDGVVAALEHAEHEGLRVEVLGGGSNVLIVDDVDALVLQPQLRGIEWLGTANNGRIHVRAAAGESWHEFVGATLDRGAFGLENLALIPGHVGAAPIQNIGAYGVELQRFVVAVEAFDRVERRFVRIEAVDCGFSYRDSRFKHEDGRHLIVAVEFALSETPQLRLDYAGVREELAAMGAIVPTPKDVYRAVSAIRRRKLPDPATLGNAGSFFKNPLVSTSQAERLKSQHPRLSVYPAAPGLSKLAAGWLIEHCGWKGFRDGDAGVHQQHALVLVNHGHASGGEILALAQRIQADVHARFGVDLEIEPRVIQRSVELDAVAARPGIPRISSEMVQRLLDEQGPA